MTGSIVVLASTEMFADGIFYANQCMKYPNWELFLRPVTKLQMILLFPNHIISPQVLIIL